jgi:outer membrane protein assembly factor BamE (lipoprotein component of BamABCDE complex)
MFRVNLKLFSNYRARLVVFGGLAAFALLAATSAQAQRSKGSLTNNTPEEGQPTFHEVRGVHIGMAADEARKKLGTPRDKSAEQDLYVFNDNEALQVYYDKSGAVTAISVDFMSGASGVPTSKDVFGSESEAKSDGSIFKRVDYPKAGYWISYSRTAGSDPTITITIQKIR